MGDSRTGGTVPFTPSTALPFIGKTGPADISTPAWSYGNPFNFGNNSIASGSAAPVMSVPFGAATSSMTSQSLLDQMTSVPMSSAFGTNNVTKDMRTNHTIPYARAQNTEQSGLDMWKGISIGMPMFLFTEKPFASPFGVFDKSANFYLTRGRPGGFNLGDTYESYFRGRPSATFSANYTLPQVNFLLASSELSRSVYGGEKGEGCFTAMDVQNMFTFDGIMYNQEGGENTKTGYEMSPDKGIIYNIVRDGTSRKTKNVWSNDVGVQDLLWLVCKRMEPPKEGYRINPNDTTRLKPQVPKRLLESLDDSTRGLYSSNVNSRPWQFVPWSSKYKHAPTEEDLMSKDEYGIECRGFAVCAGLNRYEPSVISRETIARSKYDAFASLHCEDLEIYCDVTKLPYF